MRYLPAFQLWDPYVTREMTVRDLLVHRSGLGLGAGDLLWWPPSHLQPQGDRAHGCATSRPATSFRSAYAYDNVLYLVAGEVIEAVSGQSWEDFVSTRILQKVGMTGSNVRPLGGRPAAATSRRRTRRVDGKVSPIAPFESDNTNPAGGINSSAEDMAKWMTDAARAKARCPTDRGSSPKRTYRQLTTLVTPHSEPATPPPELAPLRANFSGYALGLGVRDYRGHKMLTHTGGLPGYVSRVMLVPDASLGVAVLTNQESARAFDAIALLDSRRQLPRCAADCDWLAEAYRARDGAAGCGEVAEARGRRPPRRETRRRGRRCPLAGYAGDLRDAWYGDIAIALEDGELVMRFTKTPSLVGELEHWQHDTFVVRWRDRELRADAFVTFALNPDGTVDQARMRAVSPETDFSFDFQDLKLEPVRK